MLEIVVYIAVVVAFWVLVDLVTRDRSSSVRREVPAARRLTLVPRRLLSRRRAHRQPAADPFVALELQLRLAAVASEIQRLERERHAIAVAHHLRASQYAYDALLSQACRLAGLDDSEPAPPPSEERSAAPGFVPVSWTVDEAQRMRQELELGARGWSW